MKPVWNILFLQQSRWLIGVSDGVTAEVHEVLLGDSDWLSAESADAAVSAALAVAKKLGAAPGPLLLALPSSHCFAATVPTDGLLKKQRSDGLLYRLEEQLPIDAECVTADFIEYGNSAMGVATRNAPLLPVLQALETAGIDVVHICPSALLIHETSRLAAPISDPGPNLRCNVTAADTEHVDLILVEGQDLVVWRSVRSDPSLIQTEIDQLTQLYAASKTIHSVTFAPGLRERTLGIDGSTDEPGYDPDAALLPTVRRVFQLLRDRRRPIVDLRRGELAGRSLWSRAAVPARVVVLAACLLFLAVGAVATRHGNLAIERAESAERAQAALFREVFPNQAVPAAPVSRFRSEAAKAKGTSGTGDTAPRSGRAFEDLRDVLAGLPPVGGIRFRLLEARIDHDRFYLDGQARSHADADRLVAGLRGTLGYTLDPPRTQNLTGKAGQGITFTLSGFRAQDTP